ASVSRTVFAPSVAPALTLNGFTNSPSFTQTVEARSSAAFHVRASGDICAVEEGDQRKAALGTSKALVSLWTTKRTLAVRYGSRMLPGFSVFTSTVYMTTF